MKFSATSELKDFIVENKLFSEMEYFKEICDGGTSFNFYVKTSQAGYLLKLIPQENIDGYRHLYSVLEELNFIKKLPIEKFENYCMIAMPYINGHKIGYADCTTELLEKLKQDYAKIKFCKVSSENIDSQQRIFDLAATISDLLDKENSLGMRLIKRCFWAKILPELVYLPPSQTTIHGDLTENNVIIDEDGEPHILDYGSLRYGYEIEDIAYLFLQLSGFRGLWGRVSQFAKLQKDFFIVQGNNRPTLSEWLHGIQLFYLHNLRRRIINSRKNKNLRKNLCLLLSLMHYFRLVKYLRCTMSHTN